MSDEKLSVDESKIGDNGLANQSKRALLGLAGGVVISKWTKPIVASVMLPAHAQSTINESADLPCLNLVLAGFAENCAGPLGDPNNFFVLPPEFFVINDEGSCPQIVRVAEGDFERAMLVIFRKSRSANSFSVTLEVGFSSFSYGISCANPNEFPFSLDRVLSILSTSGVEYDASHTIFIEGGMTGVSDIVFTLA